jgi:hypothetical protein
MTRLGKALLIIELVVCFAPVAILLYVGLIFFLHALALSVSSGLFDVHDLLPVAMLLAGVLGMAALFAVVAILIAGGQSVFSNRIILVFALAGFASLLPLVAGPVDSNWWRLVGLLPILAGLHVLYLARAHLFLTRRNRNKSH